MGCPVDTLLGVCKTSPQLLKRVRRCAPADIGLPATVACELYYGAYKSRHARRNVELLDRMEFEIVPFDASDARMAGAIRSELEAIRRPIGLTTCWSPVRPRPATWYW